MATVDMNLTQFYQPPSLNTSFRCSKHILHNELGQTLENSYDESDNNVFPTAVEILQNAVPTDASTAGFSQLAQTLQQLDNPAVSTTSMPVNWTDLELGHHLGNSRDRPVVIQDDKTESTDNRGKDESKDKAKATSSGVDPRSAEQDASLYSAPEQRYKTGYFIDVDSPLSLELEEQQSLSILTPAAHHHHYSTGPYHQIHPHNNDRNTQRTSEELAPRSLPNLDRGSKGENDENVFETSHSRLEELVFYSLPHNQDQDKEEPQEQKQQQKQQQQQGVVAEAIGENKEGNNNNREWEKYREKQQHQDKAKESSNSNSHNANSKDNKDLRLAKQWKLCLVPAYKSITPRSQNLTPPPATQLDATSRCDNQLESQKSSSPCLSGDKEPTSNAGAAYQE